MNLLIEKENIQALQKRSDELYEWFMSESLFHPDFYKKAAELAALSVRICNYTKNNQLKK